MITMEKIKNIVEKVFEIKDLSRNLKSRKRPKVIARQIYFYLCKNYTSNTLSEIGITLKKGHATVLHAVKTVEDTVIKNNEYLSKIELCIEMINYQINKGEEEVIFKDNQEGCLILKNQRLQNKIDSLEYDLNIERLKSKYKNKKLQKFTHLIDQIPSNMVDTFCETRLVPFVKMYGNKQLKK